MHPPLFRQLGRQSVEKGENKVVLSRMFKCKKYREMLLRSFNFISRFSLDLGGKTDQANIIFLFVVPVMLVQY